MLKPTYYRWSQETYVLTVASSGSYMSLSGPGVELLEHFLRIFFTNPGVIGVRLKVSCIITGVYLTTHFGISVYWTILSEITL